MAPDARLVVDRSLANIRVQGSFGPSETFHLAFTVLPQVPPDITVSTNLGLLTRLSTYVRLATFRKAYDESILGSCPSDRITRVTAEVALRAISANAVMGQYIEHLKEEIVDLAMDIAQADSELIELNRVLAANARLRPEQIALLITQIDRLQLRQNPQDPSLETDESSDLAIMRNELISAQKALKAGVEAAVVFHDKYSSRLQRKLFRYQGDVLEYAQFSLLSELERNTILKANIRSWVKARISVTDVIISDGSAGGKGKAIRTAFGIPDPAN